MTLFTIGFTQKNAREFFSRLRRPGFDTVTSRLILWLLLVGGLAQGGWTVRMIFWLPG